MQSTIIQGSARKDGHTQQIAKIVSEVVGADILHLQGINLAPYQYDHLYPHEDDFLAVMERVVSCENLIFITPVYWYAMSGLMKNFFDRITDCIKVEKAVGKKLKDMNMMAISCGSDSEPVPGFFVPFRRSATYLGMHYLGDTHTWLERAADGPQGIEKLHQLLSRITDRH
ncbi:MAG: NAD(P)H-dependent oxidoreductase [Saprospiraceae bacterium]|nr:NAD(P)H-dependent oxidoreductase [Saprospiraceae bacterium]